MLQEKFLLPNGHCVGHLGHYMSGYCNSVHMKCWVLGVHSQPSTEGQVQNMYNEKIKTGTRSEPMPFMTFKNLKTASKKLEIVSM